MTEELTVPAPLPDANAAEPEDAGKKKKNKSRIWEVDLLRGICMLLMICDHTMLFIDTAFSHWDSGIFGKLADIASSWEMNSLRIALHPVAIFIFFFLGGVSTGFTKKPLVSTIKLVVVALLYNIGSWLASIITGNPYITVHFGVLNCFAVTRLLYCAFFYLHAAIKKSVTAEMTARDKEWSVPENPVLAFLKRHLVTIILSIIGIGVSIAIIFIGDYLAKNNINGGGNWLLIFAVPPNKNYYTFDYFSVFPHAGYFILGIIFSRIAYFKRRSLLPIPRERIGGKIFYGTISPFTFLGHYSLYVYLLHLPVIMGLLTLISILFGFGSLAF